MPNSHAQAGGFSLIEVLVALSVLALGVAGSAKLSELGYEQLSATQNYNQAAFLAHGHLTSLNVVQSYQDLGPVYQKGSYNQRFNWELSLTSVELESLPSSTTALTRRVIPVRADLTIRFENNARSLELHSLILAPAEPLDLAAPESTLLNQR